MAMLAAFVICAAPPRMPVGIFEMSFPATPPTPGIIPTAADPMFFRMEKNPGSPE